MRLGVIIRLFDAYDTNFSKLQRTDTKTNLKRKITFFARDLSLSRTRFTEWNHMIYRRQSRPSLTAPASFVTHFLRALFARGMKKNEELFVPVTINVATDSPNVKAVSICGVYLDTRGHCQQTPIIMR